MSADSSTEWGGATVGRFITFLDAAVAIAMTLLILPLTEAVAELPDEGPDAGTVRYLTDHGGQILSLVLSFVIIATFWVQHHRVMREDTPFGGRLALANFVWLLAVVVLPVSTALVGSHSPDRAQIALYIGTMAFGGLSLVWITHEARANRRAAGMAVGPVDIFAGSAAMTGLFLVALAVALVFPAFNYNALFIMFLVEPLRKVIIRLIHR